MKRKRGRQQRVGGEEGVDGLEESDRKRNESQEEEKACYLGRVAVWELPFLQCSHQVLMTQCSARKGRMCAKMQGSKVTDM